MLPMGAVQVGVLGTVLPLFLERAAGSGHP